MKNRTISEKIADFAYKASLNDIPNDVVKKAKLMLLDFLASAIGGYNAAGSKEIVDLATKLAPGKCSIIGYKTKVSPPFAALANGTIGHALDYDDTHSKSVLHPSVVIAPAVFSLGEDREVSGERLMISFIVGVETVCKLGLACKIGPLQIGYIYTSLLGTFGASIASAKLLNLTRDEMINSLGIAYSFTSGNAEQLIEGTLSKRLQAGIASMNGLIASLLSSTGFTGAKEAFEGKYGFFNVYIRGNYDTTPIDELGCKYEIPYVSFKPYPCCRLTHTSIDAVLILKKKYNLKANLIEEIIVGVNKQAYNANVEPIDIKKHPRNVVDAQFSIPYTVAVALLYGKVSIEDFTENSIKRKEVLKVAEKVTPVIDDEIEKRYGREISPATVTIKLTNGKVLNEKVIYPLGEPQNPMDEKMLVNKFLDASRYSNVLPLKEAEDIAKMILSIEKINNVRDIMDRLVRKTR